MIVLAVVGGLLVWCVASVLLALFLGGAVRLRDTQVPGRRAASAATDRRGSGEQSPADAIEEHRRLPSRHGRPRVGIVRS